MKVILYMLFSITITMNMLVESIKSYRKYNLTPELENRSCALSDLSLNEESTRTVLDCLLLCTQLGDDCTSAFYMDDGVCRTCHGCSRVYTSSSSGSLEYLIGSEYYVTGKGYSYLLSFSSDGSTIPRNSL